MSSKAIYSLFLGVLASLCVVSCSNYELLKIRALQLYESRGAKVVSYSNPITEDSHFIFFEYNNSIYVNYLDKQKNLPVLMNDNTKFKVCDFSPRIDNESYQIILQKTIHDWQSLSTIIGGPLNNAEFYQTGNDYSFFIKTHRGRFLFDIRYPDRLIHFVSSNLKVEDSTIACTMEGDLREYMWEDPIPYISYYTEPQTYSINGRFDLEGNCLGFSDFYYNDCFLQNPIFIDERLEDVRKWIESHYQTIREQESEARYEHLYVKASNESIPLKDIISSFSYEGVESDYIGQLLAFHCSFDKCDESDRPDYKYKLVYLYSGYSTVWLYSNDDRFTTTDYPKDIYVFCKLASRNITGSGFWSVTSVFIFEDAIFAGYK